MNDIVFDMLIYATFLREIVHFIPGIHKNWPQGVDQQNCRVETQMNDVSSCLTHFF